MVFPPVALLVAVDVLFADVAFCANADIVLRFSAVITVTTRAVAIKLPNLRDFFIRFLTRGILFIDCCCDIYFRNVKLLNVESFIS